MADDREYEELEAALAACFSSEFGGGSDHDDDRDENSGPSERETAQAFARYCQFNNIQHPMAPFLDVIVANVKDDCVKIYNEEKIKIKGILKNLDGQISISAEMLRNTSCDDYICLKAHFIDENWKLKEWVLRYHGLTEDVFVTGIQKGLAAWGIEDKVSTITIKAPNFVEYIDEMAEEVKEQVQKKKTLQLGGRLFNVYCCAELLNQTVQVAFKEVSDIIDKVKLLSWSKSEPCWHLTNSKLKNAMELKSMGEFDSLEPGGFYEVPSEEEWKKVKDVCNVVDAIETVAKFLFLKKNPTACDFLGNLMNLKVRLTSEAAKIDDSLKGIVEEMIKKLDEYLKNMFLLLGIATVMDPRCKMHYVKFMCTKTEAGEFSTVLDAVRILYSSYCSSISNLKRKMEEENGAEKPEEGGQVEVDSTCTSQKKNDLDLYLEDPVLSWSQDFNLLNWWKESSSKYPTVAKMARDLLPIPWLGITSYDAYYTEERLVDMFMVSKGQKFMNAVMCTRSWLSKRS